MPKNKTRNRIRSSSKKSIIGSKSSKPTQKRSKRNLILAGLLFGVIGSLFVFRSFAALTELVSVEAEKMTLNGAVIINDNLASGSQAAKLTSKTNITSQITISAPATSITVKAKGEQCQGAPIIKISVAGNQIPALSVSSTSWNDYTAATTIPAGTHALSVSFDNPYTYMSKNQRKACIRTLSVDKVTLFGNTTTPPPPPSSQIYWGARMDGDVYGRGDAPWDSATWDTFEQHASKKVSVVHYGQQAPWTKFAREGSYLDTTALNLVSNRGAIPLLSMDSESVSLDSIASGAYDSSLRGWADRAKAHGKPFMLRWNWEMNGSWFNWGVQAKTNPASYVNAWRHFHDVVRAQGATNVTWAWCPNVEFAGSTPLSSLYPGDAYVDWTCLDGYNWGTNPLKPSGWQSFTQVFQQSYNTLNTIAPSKPIIIAETASSEYGGSKANWTTNALSSELPSSFPNIKALVWFNWNIYENGGRWDWPIESSSSAQAAFTSGIGSNYYAPNNYGNLPLLTKVQPITN